MCFYHIPECYNLTKEEKKMLLAISNGIVKDSIDGYRGYKPNMSNTEKKFVVNSLYTKGLIVVNADVPGCDFWMIGLAERGKDLIGISPKLRNWQIRRFIYKQIPTNKKTYNLLSTLVKVFNSLFTLRDNK